MKKVSRSHRCSNCGAQARITTGNYPFSDLGLPGVTLMGIDLLKCAACGNVDPVIPRLNHIMRVLAEAVTRKPSKLRGEEIRFLRKYLNMTGSAFASLIGADQTTLSKWENNEDQPGDRSDRLIRAVAVSLGEGLGPSASAVVRTFPGIERTSRVTGYMLDVEHQTCEYAASV